jgi:hypothetical protein
LDSAYFSPETLLPAHLLLSPSEPDEIKPEIPKVAKKIEKEDEPPPRPSHWIGLIASVSVGIIIALVVFPMIRYAERSTRDYVTDSWVNEISRRVDQYEQIHGTKNDGQVEEMPPYNLAFSGWQELHSGILASPSSRSPRVSTGRIYSHDDPWNDPWKMSLEDRADRYFEGRDTSIAMAFPLARTSDTTQNQYETIRHHQQPLIPLPNLEGLEEPMPLDISGFLEYILLIAPGQEIPVRSAYGQDILIKDGRVFFRSVPSTELLKK